MRLTEFYNQAREIGGESVISVTANRFKDQNFFSILTWGDPIDRLASPEAALDILRQRVNQPVENSEIELS